MNESQRTVLGEWNFAGGTVHCCSCRLIMFALLIKRQIFQYELMTTFEDVTRMNNCKN